MTIRTTAQIREDVDSRIREAIERDEPLTAEVLGKDKDLLITRGYAYEVLEEWHTERHLPKFHSGLGRFKDTYVAEGDVRTASREVVEVERRPAEEWEIPTGCQRLEKLAHENGWDSKVAFTRRSELSKTKLVWGKPIDITELHLRHWDLEVTLIARWRWFDPKVPLVRASPSSMEGRRFTPWSSSIVQTKQIRAEVLSAGEMEEAA